MDLSKARTVRDSREVVDFTKARTVRPHEEIYKEVKDADPAKIAEATRNARALNTDPLEVYEFPEDARHAASQPDFDAVRAKAPTLARDTEKTNFMALVQKDIDNLAKLEAATRERPKLTVGRLVGATWESMRSQMSQFAEVDATSLEAVDAENMQAFQEIVESGSTRTQEEYSRLAYEADGVEWKPGMKANTGYQRDAFEQFLKTRHEAARKTADKYALPEEYRDTSGDIESTLKAIAGSSAGMVGGPGMMFAQIKGASIQSLREEGVTDPQVLGDASTIEALGSTPLESAGTLLEIVILSKVPGGAKMLKKVLGRFVKTNKGRRALIKAMKNKGIAATEAIAMGMGTEGMEEYLQAYPGEYARLSALSPEADSDEILSQFFESVTTAEFQEQAGEAARIGAFAGGTMIGGGAAINATYNKMRKKLTAEQTAKQVETLVEIAKEIEVLRTEPTTFTDYLRKVEESTGSGKFYLQADEMIAALQEQDIDPVEWANQYGIGPVELTEAMQVGEGMLALDSASVIAGLAQGEDVALATLQDKLLASPEDFSASQVEEGTQSDEGAQKRIQELYEDEKARSVSRAEVLELEQALTDTGVYTGAQARDTSLLMGARANTWAKKTGNDAADWFKRWGVSIRDGVYLEDFEDLATKMFTHDEMLYFPHESDISSEKPGAPIFDEMGEQVGRTPSLQPNWYTNNQYKTSYSTKAAAKLIKKAREGADLTETQELFVREAVRINKEELTSAYSQSMGVFAWLRSKGYPMGEAIDIIDAFVADPSRVFKYGEGELTAKEIQSEYASGVGRFYQGSKAPRGIVEFRTGRTTVTLFETANLSTMLHETGHIFLEDLKETAEQDGVEVDQWDAVKTWLGVTGDTITTAQHEQFARAFESYLREGQAPSIELRGAFESFRKWLVNIYRAIRQLDVEVNDEIRGVFDAMLATEDQIAEAQALAAQTALLDEVYMREAGSTQDEIDEYRRSVAAAGAAADRDGFRHKVVGRDERRREWRKQAKEEAAGMAVFEVIDQLKEVGLDADELETTYGKDTRKAIPNNLKKKDGISSDQAAARYGYESGRALVEDIVATPSKAKWIDAQVEALDQEFNERWDAEEAIHNRLARDLFEEESLKLAQKLQRKALSRKALRRWAEETTAAQKAGEAANVYKLIAQSRKLRKKAIAAQKAGKDAEAFDLNEKVRMTEELIAVRYKVRDELQKAERRWKRFGKRAMPPRKGTFNYDERHAGQVRKILTRYQLLGKRALPFPNVRLADFFNEILAEEQDTREDVITSMGEGAGFATFLFDESDARQWRKQLTLEEVREVDNLLKALMKDGRLDKKDLLSDGTSLKATAEGLAAPMVGMKATRNMPETNVLARITRKQRKFMAEHIPLQYILMRADGFKSGANIARLFNSITERVDDQHRLVKRVNDALSPALEHFKARSQEFPEVLTHVPIFDQFKTAQPSLVWTFDKVMAVALNMGNVDNAQKLIDGYTIDGEAISIDTLLEITSIFDARDWEMVQKIWDGINIMWPPTVEMHERLKGYKPQKVKGNPLTVTVGDGQVVNLDGGYYPLKFDTRLNTEQSDLSAKQAEFEDLKQHQEALFPSVAPKAGQTMARKATAGGRQVELGMGVLAKHINHASMYATMADVLNDVDRITQQAGWKKSFKTAFGDTMYDMIRPALATVANPTAGRGTMSSADNVIEWLRARTAPIILFFNLRVAVKQPYSIFNLYQSMRANGNALSNIGKGYTRAMKNPVGLYGEVHDLSAYMERRAEAIDRELQKGLKTGEYRKKTGKRKAFDAVQDWGDEWGPIFIRLGDFAAAYPGWWAAYEQGLQMFNGDLGKAVHHADNHIRATQPSFAPVDTAALQRSNAGMARLFTMFTGYTMKYANRRHFYWEGFRKGEITGREFAFHVALERMAPSLVMSTMLTLLTRGVPEDDEEWQMFFEDALLDLLLFQMAGRVGIQEIAAVVGLTKYGRGGTFKTPLSAVPDSVKRRWAKITSAVDSGDEDEIIEALFWFMLTSAEIATKIPLAQRGSKLKRNLDEFEDEERTAPGVLF